MDQVMDAAGKGVAAGATWGAIVSAWEAQPVMGERTGALVFSTTRTIATHAGRFGLFAAIFAASKATSEGVRGTEDPMNSFVGGCVAGGIAGAYAGKVGMGVGGCLVAGTAAALFSIASKQSAQAHATSH
ncbi:hypothetical protein PTSG_03355 [Salpingoeca rosetta]|uniref:Uncharacterized protein n=1 Tax=Salpingoeca rosetta (strain ATCC 50818 / BSB-021) TaxID=946362 RepID=F2U4X8_SALR5|nr:uncharacterized protein PTSG_03355 [Salpingoeca rosetta]EGD82694.1 hypothetical protein PTSG_03355 [Salpingoeca rosetta]|eukprot:XP_004995930.1 hypothetical protein PTSG_03355 [Salpingoeca rosetta]